MTPIVLAGICEFGEQHQRVRVFALCKMEHDPVLKPVSAIGDPTVRGMRLAASERQLTLQIGRLPATMTHAFIGLSVPRNHDLTEGNADTQGPFALKLTLDNGATSTIPMHRAPRKDHRYALLAVIVHNGPSWTLAELTPREYYRSRSLLNAVHQTPTWWNRHA